jgi:Predicted phosphatase/phosphohexomutase
MGPEIISKNNQIKAILFDMDGVLVDSMTYHLESWNTVLGSFDIKVSDQFIFEHEGAMAPEVIKNIFKENGYLIDNNQINDIYLNQNTIFLTQYLPKVDLYPESIPLLKQLKAKGIWGWTPVVGRRNLLKKYGKKKS